MDILRAKEIISALADGIDPTTGELLPKQSPFNNPEVIRALFFVQIELLKKSDKPNSANAGTKWTDEEEDKLVQGFDNGLTSSQLAKIHGRGKGAIETRLFRIGKTDKPSYFDRRNNG